MEEGSTTDASDEGKNRPVARGKKRKEKMGSGQTELKLKVKEQEEEISRLKERLEEIGTGEELQPDFALLPYKKNLPTVEQIRDEISLEPYFAVEGIMIDSANRINKIADCSNNIRGDLVPTVDIHYQRVGKR